MSDGKACLPFWEGFQVVGLQVGADTIHITLEPDPASRLTCGGSGRSALLFTSIAGAASMTSLC